MKRPEFYILHIALVFVLILSSCKTGDTDKKNDSQDSTKLTEYKYPERTHKSNIYEVNIRQYTQEGTIKAFEEHLPRLKEMGVDILWLMPVFPIGEKFRKATQNIIVEEIKDPEERKKYLGSYYASSHYTEINPEFGTKEDFRSLVQKAHELGMLIILDIAANHTGWDHIWFEKNPEFYTKVEEGETPWNQNWMEEHPEYFKELSETRYTYPIQEGETDWWDTADLNYDNDSLRKEMINALKYWVKEFDVDGYRCDVADRVPKDFWEDVRVELETIKPVFMLAEAETLELHDKAFDMGYAWHFHHLMNQVAQGKEKAKVIREYFEKAQEEYPQKVYRMSFTSNHDENTWNGTVFERMSGSHKTFAVLSFVTPGMPLIYSGQEAGLDKRLKFFEKDTIEWREHEMTNLYKKLISLKNENKALWNGEAGSLANFINTSNEEHILTFKRHKDENTVLVIMNLSSEEASFSYLEKDTEKEYTDYFSGETMIIKPQEKYTLNAWEYKILILKK